METRLSPQPGSLSSRLHSMAKRCCFRPNPSIRRGSIEHFLRPFKIAFRVDVEKWIDFALWSCNRREGNDPDGKCFEKGAHLQRRRVFQPCLKRSCGGERPQ